MAHIGRTVKNVEAPRPLKSQSRLSLKNNYMLIEELIQLIENVALTLQSGINNTEPMASLVQNLRMHGPQLETVSKDTLDRAFVVFRNASQDERLNIMTRLNLLELIELRAKGWDDHGFNSYYKTKQATNVEIPDSHQHMHQHHQQQHQHHYHHQHQHVDHTQQQTAFLSTSPTFGGSAVATAIATVGSAQQQLLLGPGEVIRNSGKFPKPTKIPGKTYCKDEVVIRNADSGKVMGIKGRRVHMIEELSETIISFQRVNPGAKERLVQITGPTEEKINYAKQLIEDTIRRNASPVRLEPAMGVAPHGSCSSLASSNSDEVTPRNPGGAGGSSAIANRLSFNSAQNFMTATAAAQQAAVQQQHVVVANMMGASAVTSTSTAAAAAAAAGKVMRPNHQMLLHSFSTNDASLGEYKYTVNVGQHLIKITGDCCDLVRVAKLVLDDYFSSAEFLASVEAGAAFDGSMISPISTPSTPMGAPQFAMGTPLHAAPPLADSGIGLNYMAGQMANNANDVDDEVFVDANGLATSASQSNGLARSRRSHFSRKDSTPEAAAATAARIHTESVTARNLNADSTRIVHEYEHLLYYAKSPHAWALPAEWQKICEKFPAIVRNKVMHVTTTPPAPTLRVASTTTSASNATTTATTSFNSVHTTTNINVTSSLSIITPTLTAIGTTSCVGNLYDLTKFSTTPTSTLTIKRKGFFNRQTYSIDEDGYDALQQQQQSQSPYQQRFVNYVGGGECGVVLPYNNDYSNYSANVQNLNLNCISNTPNNSWVSIRSGPTTASFANSKQAQVAATNNHNRQKLLSKQIKIISAIMEGSKKFETHHAVGTVEGRDDDTIIDDDDDVVEFVGETKYVANDCNRNNSNVMRPKMTREYRSNSTCD